MENKINPLTGNPYSPRIINGTNGTIEGVNALKASIERGKQLLASSKDILDNMASTTGKNSVAASVCEAAPKQDYFAYFEAFHFLTGIITSRERLGLPALPAAKMLQMVYDSYGVLPIDSEVKRLGIKLKP